MDKAELVAVYRDYIACLNRQGWPELSRFVSDSIAYNGKKIGLSGYRQLLEKDFREIPDLQFNVELLVSDPPYVVSRLLFNCTPLGLFFGLPVNGRRVSFGENVFYRVEKGKIETVWSVIDKAAIEAQLV